MRKLVLLLIFCAMFLPAVVAQEQAHFGHIDFQKVLNNLPEKLAAEKQLQEETQKLRDQLLIMNADLEQKYQDYIQRRDSMPHLVKVTKEKELQDAEGRIKQYKDLAMQSITVKEQELLEPVIKKLMDAIEAVREEFGLVYVFDISSQVILAKSPMSLDVEPHVIARLGL